MIFSSFESENFEENYLVKMFTKNSIPGFLPAELQMINAKPSLSFDITSRHSLLSYLETRKINNQLYTSIMQNLYRASMSLNSYMLDNCFFMLSPEYVFLESDLITPVFCYCPIKEDKINYSFISQLKILMDFIITALDYSDKELVASAFTLHQHIISDNFDINELMHVMDTDKTAFDSSYEKMEADETDHMKDTPDDLENELTNIPNIKNTLADSFSKYNIVYLFASIFFIIFVYLRFMKNVISNTTFYFASFILLGITLTAYSRSKGYKYSAIADKVLRHSAAVDTSPSVVHDAYDSPAEKIEPEELPEPVIEEVGETVLINPSQLFSFPHFIYNGDDFNDDFELTTFPFLIGKLPESSNHIIHNSMISRIHAKIHHREDGYYLEDMNSSNGTYLNGTPLPPHTMTLLTDNDIVSFATLNYIFKC